MVNLLGGSLSGRLPLDGDWLGVGSPPSYF